MYDCKIIKDSITKYGRHRLTTFEITLPRIVLAEFNTHTILSRNSASSRAIPVEKMIDKVMKDPFIPVYWGKNQKGMQAEEELEDWQQAEAVGQWLRARDNAVEQAKKLLDLGIHKQITNRLLEPWLWHTIIATATEWSNFFALRTHKDAQPEIRKAAMMMKEAYEEAVPAVLDANEWHLPFVDREEMDATPLSERTIDFWKRVSVGRCARVSYLTHDGRRAPVEDEQLALRLLASGHMSPWQHVARPMTHDEMQRHQRRTYQLPDGTITESNHAFGVMPGQPQAELLRSTYFSGNYNGWLQLRKTLKHEHDFSLIRAGET